MQPIRHGCIKAITIGSVLESSHDGLDINTLVRRAIFTSGMSESNWRRDFAPVPSRQTGSKGLE